MIVTVFVLIETLWNVKTDSRIGAKVAVSINRNIVECKGDCECQRNSPDSSINRNIVECKDIFVGSLHNCGQSY